MARTAKMARRQSAKKKTTRKAPPNAKKRVAKKVTQKAAKKLTRRSPQTAKKKVVAAAQRTAGLQVGQLVPDFSVPGTAAESVSLSHLKGKAVVLYFYPKDNTPGCTVEGQDFKKLHKQFQALGCEVFGVSRDTLKSHENFKSKFGFPFELLSDENEQLCRMFDVIRMKKLYGREFEGIERSTFVIDRNHVLRSEWRKVKVEGHAQAVLEFVKKELA